MIFLVYLIIVMFLIQKLNIALTEDIENKLNKELNQYLEDNKIELDVRETIFLEGLVYNLLKEIMPNNKDNAVTLRSFFMTCRTWLSLEQEIDEFIFFLESCYPELLGLPDSQNTNELEQEYFITFKENNKYLTIFFTYFKGIVVIKKVSDSLNSLSLKEQYMILNKWLKNLKEQRNNYNYSKELEKRMDNMGEWELIEDNEEMCLKRKLKGLN